MVTGGSRRDETAERSPGRVIAAWSRGRIWGKGRPGILSMLAVCVVILLPFFIVSLYNHPLIDDFWCTSMVRKYGYRETQIRLYNTVPPRFLALALGSLAPLSFGNFWGYKVIPVVFIVIFWVALVSWCRTVFGLKGRGAFLPALLFLSLNLAVMPGIAEGIYWTSALSVYYVGIVLFMVWSKYMLDWYYSKRKAGYFVVTSLCLIAMAGCNEFISMIALTVLGAAICSKRKLDVLLAVQLILLLGCLFLVFRFHGIVNRYEVAKTSGSRRLFYSLGYALSIDGYYIGRCLINPFFWAVVFVSWRYFLGWAGLFYMRYGSLFDYPKLLLAAWLLPLVAIPFLFLYMTGERPPLRICNLIVFFFLLGLVTVAAYMARRTGWSFKLRYRQVIVMGLVVMGLLLRNNVSRAFADIYSGTAAKYDKAWEDRYKLIRQCRDKVCVVPKLGRIPFVFWFTPDVEEPHLSDYFGKRVIVAQ
jgi:hypothetical protein